VGSNVLGSAGVVVVVVVAVEGVLRLRVSKGEGGQRGRWSQNKSSRLSYPGLRRVSEAILEMALRGVCCQVGWRDMGGELIRLRRDQQGILGGGLGIPGCG
jgi:hypothetical protein